MSFMVQAFVVEVVRRRVGKYMEPGHPIQLTHAEAQQVHHKAVREVLGKEYQVNIATSITIIRIPVSQKMHACMYGSGAGWIAMLRCQQGSC